MIVPGEIEGFVLAGGASRRFGSDKARAIRGGRTLVEINAAVLSERFDRVRVVSAPARDYSDLGLWTVFDEMPGLGPLAGIHAALRAADTEFVAIAACDLVGLQSEWYQHLETAWQAGAAAFRDERWHPLVAIYHRDVLAEIDRRLLSGELAVRDLLDAVCTPVPPPHGFHEMRSANTVEEL